jgi:predicted phosphodiesterase
MTFAFDLISDLHIESWDTEFDWTGQPTSQFCIVAGDVSRDLDILVDTLRHLGKCYRGVFYIDGNDEYRNELNDIGARYLEIKQRLNNIENVLYLQDNAVVIDGVAILSTNGWWSWDLDPAIDPAQTQHWYQEKTGCLSQTLDTIGNLSMADALYLRNSVRRLQTHQDVRKIVIVTHTVPTVHLIDHDLDLDGNYRMNCMGNSYMEEVLQADTESKISHWCFGHYHSSVDRCANGIRFVNNCRGRGDSDFRKVVYHPLRIEVET